MSDFKFDSFDNLRTGGIVYILISVGDHGLRVLKVDGRNIKKKINRKFP